MLEGAAPRVFALPPGADFAACLVAGFARRAEGMAPEAVARAEIWLNTARMLRHVRAAFQRRGAGLLPKLRLIGEIARDPLLPAPMPVPDLRRRLEIARFVARLGGLLPELTGAGHIYALADSLAGLMGEMHEEGVTLDDLGALEIAQSHAEHWQKSLVFLRLVAPYFEDAAEPDTACRMRRAVEARIALWRAAPPAHPVIVAGSTGSRGSTALFMEAVARLPQGAVVLPGLDPFMPGAVWEGLTAGRVPQEDHPQFRLAAFCARLGLAPNAVPPWQEGAAPAPERARIVSLALRPAPVTDQWIAEGAMLPPIGPQMAGVSLLEARDPRQEALALALVLRGAAEAGRRAALVTPDRTLARRVAAMLARWGIVPDDSAGEPLHLSPPGRFLRHVAQDLGACPTIESLLVLLKHPLTATGAGPEGRRRHLQFTRRLELHLRRHGPAFPDRGALADWARAETARAEMARAAARGAAQEGSAAEESGQDALAGDGLAQWTDWLGAQLAAMGRSGEAPLADWVGAHRALAGALAAGPGGEEAASELWREDAGTEACKVMEGLAAEAGHGGAFAAAAYRDLVSDLLSAGSVRKSETVDPLIDIWGTLEARVMGAELVLLGGLNEGVWPGAPAPDPWLSRPMRLAAGLVLPERQIGLAAHDFQQALGAREVVLSRALRDAEAQTVPSRWLNRLTNLLGGLPARGGPEALAQMRARGRHWSAMAEALEAVTPAPRAPRPSPRPPAAARPRDLYVTDISRLIRDPYAIYARRILNLRPLPPLRPDPDARMRGQVLHEIAEGFARGLGPQETPSAARLIAIAEEVLARAVPWPTARRLWLGRIAAIAESFARAEAGRRARGTPVVIEREGAVALGEPAFTLRARPDRIDRLADGTAQVFDYKANSFPTTKQMARFEVQLPLEAAMVERGGFEDLGPMPVRVASFLRLGGAAEVADHMIDPETLGETWKKLRGLIACYLDPAQGYTARRAPQFLAYPGEYDHLARYGEWSDADTPQPQEVGR